MIISRQKNMPRQILQILLCTILLAGCTGLRAPQVETPHIYVLDARATINKSPIKRDLVLAISMPRARPGFDTSQMAYLRKAHELNYFVTNRWADTPARMLDSLLVQALEQTTSFRAVVQAPSSVPANIRLDTELIRIQQNFETQPSKLQLTIRAQLIDVANKRVLAVKVFDDTENATSEDAYGGVMAANLALQRVLDQLADFCITESISR